jgi:hypothetical protein
MSAFRRHSDLRRNGSQSVAPRLDAAKRNVGGYIRAPVRLIEAAAARWSSSPSVATSHVACNWQVADCRLAVENVSKSIVNDMKCRQLLQSAGARFRDLPAITVNVRATVNSIRIDREFSLPSATERSR